MNKILVPTDFSSTANNAIEYALAFGKQMHTTTIVLFNAYTIPPPIVGDVMAPSFIHPEIDTFKQISEQELTASKQKFIDKANANGITLETYSCFAELVNGIEEFCSTVTVDAIIMGITGGNAFEEKLIGSNTILVAKHLHIPVIIVPSKAAFTPIEEVLLATDLKHVIETTPITQIQQFLNSSKATLFVLHVHLKDGSINDIEKEEAHKLEQLFANSNPTFNEVVSDSFTNAVNNYASNHAVDIIITIPKKRSFFENLFSTSHTNMLAFHSHVPLMVLHD